MEWMETVYENMGKEIECEIKRLRKIGKELEGLVVKKVYISDEGLDYIEFTNGLHIELVEWYGRYMFINDFQRS